MSESTAPLVSRILRAGPPGLLSYALALIGLFALILGVGQILIGVGSAAEPWIPVVFAIAFWIWEAAGIIAWSRRPTSRTGGLLILGGAALFVGGVGDLGFAPLNLMGAVFATSVLAVTVHLLLAFPSGRLRGRFAQATAAVGYGVCLILQIPLYTLSADHAELITVAGWVQRATGLAVLLATAVILIRRLRSADPRNARVLLPLYVYGILGTFAIPASASVLPLLGADGAAVGVTQVAILCGIPIAFLAGLLTGGFASTAEADALSAWVSLAGSSSAAVAQALARSLGDESIRVAYWSDERGAFTDDHGVTVTMPAPGSGRVWHEVRIQSRLVGAIDYDGRMIPEPESVRRAGQVLAIALDRERLTVALTASNEALLLSRLRLVETADRERSRIARDLHDGLQVQLVLLALEAQQLGNARGTPPAIADAATDLRRRIDGAAADLRNLVHAVLPSGLVERGLTAAAEDLVDRLAIPATLTSDVDDQDLPPAVAQSAYLIVAESLTNSVKHAGASTVRVELTRVRDRLRLVVTDDGGGGASLERGTGLKGLVDRVDALGGSFQLTSEAGVGTMVEVELPCAS